MTPMKLMKWIGALAIGLAALGMSPRIAEAATDVIQFPEEELAAESVLPVFDDPASVKNRNIVTENRIELGLFGSYSMTEPFFNPMSYGISASYHLTEIHGINLIGLFYSGGLSNYGEQLNNIPNSEPMRLEYAPQPKYLILPSYQYTGYYGKLSFSKDYVMNMHMFGLLGVGMMGIGDASKPVFAAGLGEKFYFSKSFALRVDLRMLFYRGPDVVSQKLTSATEVQSASRFDEKWQFGTLLQFGASYLFPEF
ncbi:MAG TPA: outer membrane beta-barrel domain-containing protein [Bdellovibrionales bacterium]|nr:outer membrane beta-barrel domain-containing protein [Bdellovibrionales bacterium]